MKITLKEREITLAMPQLLGPEMIERLRPILKVIETNEVTGIREATKLLCNKEDVAFINSLTAKEYIEAMPELSKMIELINTVMVEDEKKNKESSTSTVEK